MRQKRRQQEPRAEPRQTDLNDERLGIQLLIRSRHDALLDCARGDQVQHHHLFGLPDTVRAR